MHLAVQIVKDLDGVMTTSDGLAKAFGLTRPRIIQLAQENVLERDKSSKYVVGESFRRYIEYIKSGGKGKESVEDFKNDYWVEKALHEKAKRELTEIELAKMQGKMHAARDVELVMTSMLANLRTQLLGLPSQLATQLVEKTQEEVYAILNKVIEEKLTELAEYDPKLFESECVDDDDPETDD